MPERYTYLLVDFFCVLFPFIFSFHPKINFHKQWRYFIIPCLLAALFFLVWDVLFTNAGVWSFNHSRTIGIYLFGLPAEEYLFFFCVPYACVFTYYCMTLFFNFSSIGKAAQVITWLLICLLTITALFHLQQLYTSITFLLLALCLLLICLIRKTSYLSAFYVSFFIILIPFFISNGILTGSVIATPVVLYNDHFNLGIRLFTIPVEDTFYGMLLLLMNVTGFEYLRTKRGSALSVSYS
jgi:lycopene cyclase domain-containing protein